MKLCNARKLTQKQIQTRNWFANRYPDLALEHGQKPTTAATQADSKGDPDSLPKNKNGKPSTNDQT